MMVRCPTQRVLWLVRHGETNWNRMGWVQGHLDSPRLTRRGVAQARRVGSLLANKDVKLVYSSDLRRARCTAQIIADLLACPMQTDPRLRERSFGQLEGSPTGTLPPEATGIDRGRVADVTAHPDGGESLVQLADRCLDFAEWLEAQPIGGDVVVVAHGGSIRMLTAALSHIEPSSVVWTSVANASVHRIVLPGHASVVDPSLLPAVPVGPYGSLASRGAVLNRP